MPSPELNGLIITDIKFPGLTPSAGSKKLPCEFFIILNKFILLAGTLVKYPARISIALPPNCNSGNWIPTGPKFEDTKISHDWLREAVIKAWQELPFPENPPEE